MSTVKRSYSSDLRADQARRTRQLIVAAAGELFAQRGYAATTIDAVAERAGVSRKTVFTSVGGKVALIKLAFDWALTGDDEPVPMRERAPVQGFRAMTDGVQMLEGLAGYVSGVMARATPVYVALRAAADADPEARVLYQEIVAGRRRGLAEPAEQLHRLGQLRKGLSRRRAADLFWYYIDPTHFDMLVRECGWSQKEYAAWLASSLKLHLLGLA